MISSLAQLRIYNLPAKIKSKLAGNVVHLKPKDNKRGQVLLSYMILPFVVNDRYDDGHTNVWECQEIANVFLRLGYAVDVIDSQNTKFVPKKDYSYVVSVGNNFERLTGLLNKNCIKIFHSTTSSWHFQNKAEEDRILALENRRNVKIIPRRIIPESRVFEIADYVSMIGNEATANTYGSDKSKITKIHLSTTGLFPSPSEKKFQDIRKNFIWIGGSGMVHKGLDLILEAFAKMPEYSLTICGSVTKENDFEKAYYDELYNTPNIKVVGRIDTRSELFKKICNESLGIVYPSCSEGTAGSVVVSMHAGLIPIISKETGVDVFDFGVELKANDVESIGGAIVALSEESEDKLRSRAIKTWEYARKYHTRENFSKEYTEFIRHIETQKNG